MRFLNLTTVLVVAVIFLASMPEQHSSADGHIHLLFVLPALLLKIGLAAPLVLLVLVKLLLLLGLKKKSLLLPLLSGSSSHDSGEYGKSSGEGGYAGGLLGGLSNLGRIKRSVDFVQKIVGQVELSEEELLKTILKMDSRRCGEKLLCEVGRSAAGKKPKDLDPDTAAMIALFANREEVTHKKLGPAQRVLKQAMTAGFEGRDCTVRFPTCPFSKTLMTHLVRFVIGDQKQLPPTVLKTAKKAMKSPVKSDKLSPKIRPHKTIQIDENYATISL